MDNIFPLPPTNESPAPFVSTISFASIGMTGNSVILPPKKILFFKKKKVIVYQLYNQSFNVTRIRNYNVMLN